MRRADVERVEQVYRACHQRLWRSLFAWSGRADIATDAEAEAFAQVCRRAPEVRDVEAWVWRSAFRIAAGMLADRDAAGRTDQHHLDGARSSPDGVPTDALELTEAIGQLSHLQRQCVVLRHLGGFSAA
jgi:RNA polymerase sigma-70 factor (ECF subfamily)